MLMKHKLLIAIIAAIVGFSFVSCGDEINYGDTPISNKIPFNKEDSIIMVKVFKAMGYDKWSSQSSMSLKKPMTWGICDWSYKPQKGEYVAYMLKIDVACFPLSPETEFITIPEDISNLKNLNYVELIGNDKIRFKIPSSIFQCPIEHFDVDYASFEDDMIPTTISNNKEILSYLRIDNSNLKEAQIDILSKFKSLRNLSLRRNLLIGEVPRILGQLETIVTIDLRDNYYTSLDWKLFTDFPLTFDDEVVPNLNGNCLEGEIPEDVFHTAKWFMECGSLIEMKEGYGFSNFRLISEQDIHD